MVDLLFSLFLGTIIPAQGCPGVQTEASTAQKASLQAGALRAVSAGEVGQ